MKLWIDDLKPEPGPEWTRAKTYEEGEKLLRENAYEHVALDFDLGEGSKSGYDLLTLIEKGEVPTPGLVFLISLNPSGLLRMQACAEKANIPYVIVDMREYITAFKSEKASRNELPKGEDWDD